MNYTYILYNQKLGLEKNEWNNHINLDNYCNNRCNCMYIS